MLDTAADSVIHKQENAFEEFTGSIPLSMTWSHPEPGFQDHRTFTFSDSHLAISSLVSPLCGNSQLKFGRLCSQEIIKIVANVVIYYNAPKSQIPLRKLTALPSLGRLFTARLKGFYF